MKRSINIYCNVDLSNSENLVTSFAEHRKVRDLVQTLLKTGADIEIVSINRGEVSKSHKYRLLYTKGVRQTVRDRKKLYFDAVHSIFWITVYILRSRNKKIHVFYNQPPHYWLGIILAFILNYKIVYDIEDFPTFRKGKFIKNFINLLSRIIIKLPVSLKICSSTGFIDKVSLPSALYYGCLTDELKLASQVNNEFIGIHYGGHLDVDTGIQEFIGMITKFKQYRGKKFVKIFLTGNAHELEKLAYKTKFSQLVVIPNMPTSELDHLLKYKIQIGLSLKRADGLYGSTTFPSKIINYWKNDILVASTNIPDLQKNFPECYITLPSNASDIYMNLVQLINSDNFLALSAKTKINAAEIIKQNEKVIQKMFEDLR